MIDRVNTWLTNSESSILKLSIKYRASEVLKLLSNIFDIDKVDYRKNPLLTNR